MLVVHRIFKRVLREADSNDCMARILVLTNGWTGKVINGGEYHILHVLKNWKKQNQISIIMPKSGYKSARHMLSDEYKIYLSSPEEIVGGLTSEIIFYLRRILKSSFFRLKQNPEIIVSSSHLLYDVLPAFILRLRRKSKLVVYVHHIIRSFRTYGHGTWTSISLLNEKIGLHLSKKADLIFVVNDYVKENLISKGFQAEKIFVTGNGLEQETIDSVKVNTKEFDGCYCGRLTAIKGVYDLVCIWERIVKLFPQSKLVIIGHGPEYCELLRRVKTKGLDKNIVLTGFIPEENKFSLIKSSRIFISASYEEGWGIAVSEAMACGLAVVCYNLSAYDIFGNSISKVNVGNKEEMIQTVISLLTDENNRISLANKAKEVSRLLNWDNISITELKEINNLLSH
jgi:glycosyltransferase involved in cell wall biosynthesis